MKEIKLEEHIRRAAAFRRSPGSALVLPDDQRTQRSWPICMTCGREVESAGIRNVNTRSCEIWASCHGAEDYIKVTWDVPQQDSSKDSLEDPNVGWAIKRAMHDFTPFNPIHIIDTKRL